MCELAQGPEKGPQAARGGQMPPRGSKGTQAALCTGARKKGAWAKYFFAHKFVRHISIYRKLTLKASFKLILK